MSRVLLVLAAAALLLPAGPAGADKRFGLHVGLVDRNGVAKPALESFRGAVKAMSLP